MKHLLPVTFIVTCFSMGAVTEGMAQGNTSRQNPKYLAMLGNISLTQQSVKTVTNSNQAAALLTYTAGTAPTVSESMLPHPATLSSTTAVGKIQTGRAELMLMPNPNNGLFTIQGNMGTTSDLNVDVSVRNMLGQVVYRANEAAQNGLLHAQVQLAQNLPTGRYILCVRSGNDQVTFPVQVEK